MSIHDRLRRLEDRYRERGPTAAEVSAAWAGVTESAKAKLRREPVDAKQQRRDEEVLGRWQEAEGVDLTAEGEAAKARLRSVR